jgi:hypothetical protein
MRCNFAYLTDMNLVRIGFDQLGAMHMLRSGLHVGRIERINIDENRIGRFLEVFRLIFKGKFAQPRTGAQVVRFHHGPKNPH